MFRYRGGDRPDQTRRRVDNEVYQGTEQLLLTMVVWC